MKRLLPRVGFVLAMCLFASVTAVNAAPSRPTPIFHSAILLDGTNKSFTEPRVAIRADGTRYVISSGRSSDAIVFSSRKGVDWDTTAPPSGH